MSTSDKIKIFFNVSMFLLALILGGRRIYIEAIEPLIEKRRPFEDSIYSNGRQVRVFIEKPFEYPEDVFYAIQLWIDYQENISIFPEPFCEKTSTAKDLDIIVTRRDFDCPSTYREHQSRAAICQEANKSTIYINPDSLNTSKYHFESTHFLGTDISDLLPAELFHELTHYSCNHKYSNNTPFLDESIATVLGEIRGQLSENAVEISKQKNKKELEIYAQIDKKSLAEFFKQIEGQYLDTTLIPLYEQNPTEIQTQLDEQSAKIFHRLMSGHCEVLRGAVDNIEYFTRSQNLFIQELHTNGFFTPEEIVKSMKKNNNYFFNEQSKEEVFRDYSIGWAILGSFFSNNLKYNCENKKYFNVTKFLYEINKKLAIDENYRLSAREKENLEFIHAETLNWFQEIESNVYSSKILSQKKKESQ